MAYNNVPLHVKNFETVVFSLLCLKMSRGGKKVEVFYSHNRTKQRTFGFKLSGPLWALSIPDILYICQMLLYLGAKGSFLLLSTEGFINTVNIIRATVKHTEFLYQKTCGFKNLMHKLILLVVLFHQQPCLLAHSTCNYE